MKGPHQWRSVSEVFSTPRRLERSVPCANLTTIFFGRCRLTLLSLMRPGSRAPKRPDTEFSVEREIVLQLPTITRLTAALAAAFVLAGSASAFTISDIRVEGLTRTEPGTVFSHLPFRAGDEYTAEKGCPRHPFPLSVRTFPRCVAHSGRRRCGCSRDGASGRSNH